jgi:endoglucanase
MKTTTKLLVKSLSIGLLAVGGCIAPPPGSGSGPAPGSAASIGGANATAAAPAGGEAAPAAAAPSAPSAPAVAGAPIGNTGFKECSAEGMIDDGEDGNNQNMPNDNRGGYWYTFRDKKGTTVEPVAGEDGGTFAMSEGGHGSQFAARYHGKVGTGAPLFAGMGMNFVDPKAAYDASKYAGISFWAKKGGDNSTGKVRLKVPDANTDPEGGVCTECFNDFGADLNLTTEWKQYIFPWKSMKQMPGWGNPRKPHITQSKIYGIQFQVNIPSANYDIYVDDLKFICQ